MAGNDNDDVREDPAQAQGGEGNDLGAGGESDTYDPATVEVNRSRLQGAGMSQSDLDKQRDPTRYPTADRYGSPAADREQDDGER